MYLMLTSSRDPALMKVSVMWQKALNCPGAKAAPVGVEKSLFWYLGRVESSGGRAESSGIKRRNQAVNQSINQCSLSVVSRLIKSDQQKSNTWYVRVRTTMRKNKKKYARASQIRYVYVPARSVSGNIISLTSM